jgi:hypothetical protein
MEEVYISFDSKGNVLFVSTNLEQLHKYSQRYLEDVQSAGYDCHYTVQKEIMI